MYIYVCYGIGLIERLFCTDNAKNVWMDGPTTNLQLPTTTERSKQTNNKSQIERGKSGTKIAVRKLLRFGFACLQFLHSLSAAADVCGGRHRHQFAMHFPQTSDHHH